MDNERTSTKGGKKKRDREKRDERARRRVYSAGINGELRLLVAPLCLSRAATRENGESLGRCYTVGNKNNENGGEKDGTSQQREAAFQECRAFATSRPALHRDYRQPVLTKIGMENLSRPLREIIYALRTISRVCL